MTWAWHRLVGEVPGAGCWGAASIHDSVLRGPCGGSHAVPQSSLPGLGSAVSPQSSTSQLGAPVLILQLRKYSLGRRSSLLGHRSCFIESRNRNPSHLLWGAGCPLGSSPGVFGFLNVFRLFRSEGIAEKEVSAAGERAQGTARGQSAQGSLVASGSALAVSCDPGL